MDIVLVDDQVMTRAGLRCLIERIEGHRVVGEVAVATDAIHIIREVGPDAILLHSVKNGGLSCGTRYYYQLRSQNIVGLTSAVIGSFQTVACPVAAVASPTPSASNMSTARR